MKYPGITFTMRKMDVTTVFSEKKCTIMYSYLNPKNLKSLLSNISPTKDNYAKCAIFYNHN